MGAPSKSAPEAKDAVEDWEIMSLESAPPSAPADANRKDAPVDAKPSPTAIDVDATSSKAKPSAAAGGEAQAAPPQTAGAAPAASARRTKDKHEDHSVHIPEPTSPAELPREGGIAQAPADGSGSEAHPPGKDKQMANIQPPVQEKRTVVEEGTELKGNMESACPVVVHGRIKGDVQAPALTVSTTGTVEGTAKVGTIRCEGELAGEFDADHVELSGTVRDNTVIRATTIELKLSGKTGKKQIIFADSEEQDAEQPVEKAGAKPAEASAEKAAESERKEDALALRASQAPGKEEADLSKKNGSLRPSRPPNASVSQPPPAE
jgi:cytoskeletal protein CcmA (bactofilin family)